VKAVTAHTNELYFHALPEMLAMTVKEDKLYRLALQRGPWQLCVEWHCVAAGHFCRKVGNETMYAFICAG
jgi:hypothetical protein